MKAWEPEEDDIILSSRAALGPKWTTNAPKWAAIAKRLPGRTVSSVRNRWQRLEKGRKLREDGTELKNRCHQCGEPKRGHICRAKARGGPQVDIPIQLPQFHVGGGIDMGGVAIPMPMMQGGWLGGGPTSAARRPAAPPMPQVDLPQRGPVAMKRTRSGSRLVPADQSSWAPLPPPPGGGGFTVDVQAASRADSSGGPAQLMRNPSLFLRELALSDTLSPNSRGFLQDWADSPKDVPDAVYSLPSDPNAPPALRRAASGEGPVRLTRSNSSYVRSQMGEMPPPGPPQQQPFSSVPSSVAGSLLAGPSGYGGMVPSGQSQPSLSRQSSLTRGLSRQPSLSRAPSLGLGGRSVDSFLQSFLDESAALESAPPPNAIPALPVVGDGGIGGPPEVQLPGRQDSAFLGLESLYAPPSLSRQGSRSSPRGRP